MNTLEFYNYCKDTLPDIENAYREFENEYGYPKENFDNVITTTKIDKCIQTYCNFLNSLDLTTIPDSNYKEELFGLSRWIEKQLRSRTFLLEYGRHFWRMTELVERFLFKYNNISDSKHVESIVTHPAPSDEIKALALKVWKPKDSTNEVEPLRKYLSNYGSTIKEQWIILRRLNPNVRQADLVFITGTDPSNISRALKNE